MDFASIIRLNSVLGIMPCTISIIMQAQVQKKKGVSIRQRTVLKHKAINLPVSFRVPFL